MVVIGAEFSVGRKERLGCRCCRSYQLWGREQKGDLWSAAANARPLRVLEIKKLILDYRTANGITKLIPVVDALRNAVGVIEEAVRTSVKRHD